MMLPVIYFTVLLLSFIVIPFVNVQRKGMITVSLVIINALAAGALAVNVLLGDSINDVYYGTLVTGDIAIRMDALSAWFILLINFTMATGALYGLQYMKSYKDQSANLSLHCIAYLVVQSSLSLVCIIQNALLFLFVWEIMAIAAVLLVIFEHYKYDTIRAGLNYIIQSHLCIVFLSLGFIWVYYKMNSYDFKAITDFSATHSAAAGTVLFFCFFIGFAFKAGFVPFHTWLPYAHPAAPSHISGVMSGVIIKIGIYGILRMILLIKTDYTVVGYIILMLSVVTGLYGVMLAILQHNLKKLLAYHSIENIGIIGIGIGLGCIGIGTGNIYLAVAGFAGGLLHVLNHSLFKSLLFYGAGNVYRLTHTMNIEKLGGIIKKMPMSAALFLIAALAICGLPPLNGFVSEFLIYSGLLNGLHGDSIVAVLPILSSIFGLALIGGLAMLCFTKAFGVVFLGNNRDDNLKEEPALIENTMTLFPMYIVAGAIISIGLFPAFYLSLLYHPVKLFLGRMTAPDYVPVFQQLDHLGYILQNIGRCTAGLIILIAVVLFIRKRVTGHRPVHVASTWGCGYVGRAAKMQYTASSFVRTYRKLVEPVIAVYRKKKEITDVFPEEGWFETHPYDKTEYWLIDLPLKQVKYIMGWFRFLQNGKIQMYTLYGVVFIVLVIALPYLYIAFKSLIEFLNHL